MAEAVPELSVIIVNWKVRELLLACLRSVLAQTRLPPGALDIIVVDNDSGDGSVEAVAREFPAVRLIANARNVGFAAANNQAFQVSRGAFVLLLNPDTVVLDRALERMLAEIKAAPRVAALGCRLVNADGSRQRWTGGAFPTAWNVARFFLLLDHLLPGLLPRPLFMDHEATSSLDVGWVCGACMILRRAALETQLFDEAYFLYGEDMDLCDRLRQRGWRVVYSPHASVIHYQGASMKQQSAQVLVNSLKGMRQFYRRSRGERLLWLFDLLAVCGFGLRWLAYRGLACGGGAAYRDKAAAAAGYTALAWRLMRTEGR